MHQNCTQMLLRTGVKYFFEVKVIKDEKLANVSIVAYGEMNDGLKSIRLNAMQYIRSDYYSL